MEGTVIWSFLFGLIVGGILVWIYLRSEANRNSGAASEEHKSVMALLTDEKTSNATLIARLQNQDSLLIERKSLLDQSQDEIRVLNQTASNLNVQLMQVTTVLSEERKSTEEKLALLSQAQESLSNAFKALSAEALKSNSESFITLAKTQLETFQKGAQSDLELRQKSIDELVKPLKDGLENVDKKIQELDKARTETSATLNEQIKNLVVVQSGLQGQTQNLVRALRTPGVRGRWGEMQLRRVVEMAGMIEYCDFEEQVSAETDGGRLRPDMVIRLPSAKNVVIDSKAPLEGYLNSLEAPDDETRQSFLKDHARQVRNHLSKLSEKAYWDQFNPSPEFVVLFLPGETFFSAALEQDPELIEIGVRQKVIIATPTTLIALLRAVAYGWTSEKLSKNAEDISNLGKDLHDRIRVFAQHFASMGKGIEKTVESYNKAVGSLERGVLVKARKFKELSTAPGQEIESVEQVELSIRRVTAELDATTLVANESDL